MRKNVGKGEKGLVGRDGDFKSSMTNYILYERKRNRKRKRKREVKR